MGRRIGRSRWDSYLINSSHDQIVEMRARIQELESENGTLRLELQGARAVLQVVLDAWDTEDFEKLEEAILMASSASTMGGTDER